MKLYDLIYTVDLTMTVSKLQTLINNHFRKNPVITLHLRQWFAKHKMTVNDFSQITWQVKYLLYIKLA